MHGLIALGSLLELAVMNAGLFILFACGFFKTSRRRDWRAFGAFRAFLTALFTEMYGAPLTVYLVAGWFQPRLPGIDLISQAGDRLLGSLFGWRANPHVGIFQLTGFLVAGAGVALVAVAWKRLYRAQREHAMALRGPYAHIRHPLYLGFLVIIAGVLLLCPTLANLVMFPVLAVMYVRLARDDETAAIADFGDRYRSYMARVPSFVPAWLKRTRST